MPKRIGYLYEQALTLQNCTAAVLEGTARLVKTKEIRRIRENAEAYGQSILETLQAGWEPEPTRIKIINEGTEKKIRKLRIPTTRDHLIHVAIMRPITSLLLKRYDFYSCGSIPGRGQKRVMQTIKGWMRAEKPPAYAAEVDVYHAYECTRAEDVMSALRRLIKDERYLALHQKILDQMEGGLAIGFAPSHWYFNLIMTRVDNAIRRAFPGVRFVRYMDNYVFVCNRKRTLQRVMALATTVCAQMGLRLNRHRQVYPIKSRAISMLSYRYFRGYTILRKSVMFRIAKAMRQTKRHMNAHNGRSAMSLIGLTRHCDSYNFRRKYVYPVISIKRTKELISHADKKRALCRAA